MGNSDAARELRQMAAPRVRTALVSCDITIFSLKVMAGPLALEPLCGRASSQLETEVVSWREMPTLRLRSSLALDAQRAHA